MLRSCLNTAYIAVYQQKILNSNAEKEICIRSVIYIELLKFS